MGNLKKPAVGLEPTTCGLQSQKDDNVKVFRDNNLHDSFVQNIASKSATNIDPNLQVIINVWHQLSVTQKRALLAIVDSYINSMR